jgi:hypothetical protein
MYYSTGDYNRPYPPNNCKNTAEIKLMNEMRSLWEQHSAWTRATAAGIVFSQPDLEFVTKRLLRNPEDFRDAFMPYYGERIASRLDELLTAHLTIAAELVQAAKAGNGSKAADAEKRWYENADDIAAFLGRINPYWSVENWRVMLYEHLRLVKAEAVEMLRKNYQASIDATDENEKHVLEMADMMSKGIIMQFPERFAY